MNFNTYVSQTVTAFTRRDMADVNFVYQLKQQAEGVVDFFWKKEVEDIKVMTLLLGATVPPSVSTLGVITQKKECAEPFENETEQTSLHVSFVAKNPEGRSATSKGHMATTDFTWGDF